MDKMKSLFNKEPKFEMSKCKMNLKLAIGRLKLVRNKKENLLKSQKREIAGLLVQRKEESARIRVESVIREDYVIEAYELLELYCELLSARQHLLETSKVCTPDIKEAVCTLIWASARTEIPELMVVREQLAAKFGKELVEEAMENRDDCVSDKVLQRLNAKTPDLFLVLQYLNEIASQYQVDWQPPPELIHAVETPEPGRVAPAGMIRVSYPAAYVPAGPPPAGTPPPPQGPPPPGGGPLPPHSQYGAPPAGGMYDVAPPPPYAPSDTAGPRNDIDGEGSGPGTVPGFPSDSPPQPPGDVPPPFNPNVPPAHNAPSPMPPPNGPPPTGPAPPPPVAPTPPPEETIDEDELLRRRFEELRRR